LPNIGRGKDTYCVIKGSNGGAGLIVSGGKWGEGKIMKVASARKVKKKRIPKKGKPRACEGNRGKKKERGKKTSLPKEKGTAPATEKKGVSVVGARENSRR